MEDLSITIIVDQEPHEVFNAINNVHAWWLEDFKGTSRNVNDVFEVRFSDLHYTKQKLIEMASGKPVTWLVIDSHLSFVKSKTEWTGTKIKFDINRTGGKTMLRFTHQGLTPAIECYGACSNAWSTLINVSLFNLITTGTGQPYGTESTEPVL